VVVLVGCSHGGKRRTEPPPPPAPKQSFVALDREQQRIVLDYEPASAALTAYEIDFRDWRLGRLSQADLLSRAHSYRSVVLAAHGRLRADAATGETKRAKRLFVEGLQARAAALAALPDLGRYTPLWNQSVVNARAGLTIMQDVRDRARLIPLPEDAVS
jgi:peptidoglycan/xylan/chitin deacetylase (PgdA/CDA1 family)